MGAKFVSKKCGLCGQEIFSLCVCVYQSNDKIYLNLWECVCVCTRVRMTRLSKRSKVYVNLKCINLMWLGHHMIIIGMQLKLIFTPQIFWMLSSFVRKLLIFSIGGLPFSLSSLYLLLNNS